MEDKKQASVVPESDTKTANRGGGGAFGLDIGTSRIVLADSPDTHQARTQLNAFVSVPYSKMAEDMLRQREMVYEHNDGDLYVYGNDSDFFASFMNRDARRPMQHGVLNAQETRGQHMIQKIIEELVPKARKNETICFSVPGKGEGTDANLVYHEARLKRMLQSLGYQAKSVNEGLAVVFSELQQENFTGIGISLGGGMCNVCVAFMAMPMITFSIPKGGDYIDRSVAEVINETATRVRLFKQEKLDLSRQVNDPNDMMSDALHIYYEEVLDELIRELREQLAGSRHLPTIDRPIPIVLSGGTAKPPGFLQKFKSMVKANNFPVEISDIRMAKDPLTATAVGCYIAAMSEAK